jgi:hypothetical protein
MSGGKRKHHSQNTSSDHRGGSSRPKTRKTTPDGKRGGAAVRGKCTTSMYVYMVKENFGFGEKIKMGFVFLVQERR